MDRVDAEVVREAVEVGIARNYDGLVHVHVAVAVLHVVAVAVRHAGKREVARVGDRILGRALVVFEGRERHEGLDGRTRGILAAQRPVVEGFVGRGVERIPVLRVDAVDEEVGIEAGLGDQREDIARFRIDRHQRAAKLLEGFLGDALQPQVEGHHEVVARQRLASRQRPDRAAAGVDFDPLGAGHAVQLLLVGALDAKLADVVGALVVAGEALRLDALHVGVVDAADVADRVRGDFALRIGAEEARLDLEPREAEAVDREARDLLLGEPRADRQALEVLALLLELLEAAPVPGADIDDRGELVDRALHARDLARRDLECVGRIVGGEHLAVAVEDDAAVGHHRRHRNAVRLRERVVVGALHYLKPGEAPEKDREGEDDRQAREHQPVAENRELALLVAQRLADDHGAAWPPRRRTAGR